MTSTKPEPWNEIAPDSYYGTNATWVEQMLDMMDNEAGPGCCDEQYRATRRLFETAPEMYDALKCAERFIAMVFPYTPDPNDESDVNILKTIRAVLGKIKPGES